MQKIPDLPVLELQARQAPTRQDGLAEIEIGEEEEKIPLTGERCHLLEERKRILLMGSRKLPQELGGQDTSNHG